MSLGSCKLVYSSIFLKSCLIPYPLPQNILSHIHSQLITFKAVEGKFLLLSTNIFFNYQSLHLHAFPPMLLSQYSPSTFGLDTNHFMSTQGYFSITLLSLLCHSFPSLFDYFHAIISFILKNKSFP